MSQREKRDAMKDGYTSVNAKYLDHESDLMVPTDASFTRPRRFTAGPEHPMPDVFDHTLYPEISKSSDLSSPRSITADLWELLSEQAPGPDQDIMAVGAVSDVSRAFDLLRTRLRQTSKQHGWTNIGIVSPTHGCGTTFTAANLAASLSRVPASRTILMDFNLRSPGIAQAFDMDAGPPDDLSDFLAGDLVTGAYMVRANDTLAMGLSAVPTHAASEIMQDPATAISLARMRTALRPDMVLYDLPPMLSYDDTSAFLPHLDGVLLVSDATRTTAKHLAECERILQDQAPLLGVILNRARNSSIARF